jgi:phosphatidylglycerol:prolipoprotein diacylglycerol transferase
MSINGAEMCHPTFLYESLWNFAGFVFLHFYSNRRRFKGELILIYFGWYGLGRAWIEGLRTDSLYLGNTDIRVSQLLAVVSFVVCASLLLWLHLSKKYKDLSFLAISPETENQPEETAAENPDQQN